MPTTITLSGRELATVLASLRATQNVQQHQPLAPEIMAIATNLGEFEPLNHDEVDALCERINIADAAPPPPEPKRTFIVHLQQYVEELATATVEASTVDEAITIAMAKASQLDWQTGDDAYAVEAWRVCDETGAEVWER